MSHFRFVLHLMFLYTIKLSPFGSMYYNANETPSHARPHCQ